MTEGTKKMDLEQIEKAISVGGVFIWDKSALYSTGFKKSVQTIFAAIQKNKNAFIVPSFIKEQLDGPEAAPALMVIDKAFFTVLSCADYTELLTYLKNSNMTKVNLFVNDVKVRNAAIEAGKAAGVFVRFYMISEEGEIVDFKSARTENTNKGNHPKNNNPKGNHPNGNHPNGNHPNGNRRPGFTIKTVPEKVTFKPIAVSRELSENDVVYDSQGNAYKLMKQEAVNNGAVTYSTDKQGIWVKAFNKASLNTYTEAKLERMLTQNIKCEGVCWPLDVVKDADGTFRGYTINEFKGIPLHLCIFKRAGIDTYFPNWTKMDVCDLTETILKKIDFLHKKNILFGCINPAAIRIVSKTEVYFTDTDNYQIDGFPSLVHNISFTAPELLDKKVYLATKENENFAVAELVFMLMMPGKTPYAVGGDEAPEEMIKSMKFPYANGQIHGNNALPGMWRFMWSHLSALKGSFYNVFQKGGKFNEPANRQDVYYWLKAIGYYKKDLEETEDPESLKIYPRTFKRSKQETFYKCNYCGVEHPRFYFFNKYFDDFRICNSCIDKRSDVSFTCKVCNKTYYYTNRTALFHKMMKKQDAEWKDQKYCRDCKKKTLPCAACGKEVPFFRLKSRRCPDCIDDFNSQTYKWITCRDCGRSFEFTNKDHEFYTRKGLSEPVRCPSCRENRKNGNGGSNKSNSGGGLFGWLFN